MNEGLLCCRQRFPLFFALIATVLLRENFLGWTMKRLSSTMFFTFILAFASMSFCGASISAEKSPIEVLTLSPKIRASRIAVLQFSPLPYGTAGEKRPHERVFTNEIFSPRPNDAAISGDFLPADYLELINNNLSNLTRLYGLQMDLIKNSSALAQDTDLVILGAVQECYVGTTAQVTLDVRLLDGRTFAPLKDKRITKNYAPMESIPFITDVPIHTVGHHANDFHPQRSVLNLLVYDCLLDLLKLIEETIR